MKLAGTWIFIYQFCSADISGWMADASSVTVYQSNKATAVVMIYIMKTPSWRVA